MRLHRTGTKSFHPPIVGDLDLDFESMELSADEGLVLTAYNPEPGSPFHDGITLLTNWVATETRAREQSPTTAD